MSLHDNPTNGTHKVVPISTKQHARHRVIRLTPEYDGTCVLYTNNQHDDTLFSLQALAWAELQDGSIHALLPWLTKITTESELRDPLEGHWEGYMLAGTRTLLKRPPEYKTAELHAAVSYFGPPANATPRQIVQEIPDTIGTHAIVGSLPEKSLSLIEVVSWQLFSDGEIQGMVADESRITNTPVLPGDDCLIPVQSLPGFKYFFQHNVANRIKHHEPDALAAIAMLVKDTWKR